MCIICRNEYDLETLTQLNCSGCLDITSIPETLVNLTTLDCDYCPNLTSIPDTLVNLRKSLRFQTLLSL